MNLATNLANVQHYKIFMIINRSQMGEVYGNPYTKTIGRQKL